MRPLASLTQSTGRRTIPFLFFFFPPPLPRLGSLPPPRLHRPSPPLRAHPPPRRPPLSPLLSPPPLRSRSPWSPRSIAWRTVLGSAPWAGTLAVGAVTLIPLAVLEFGRVPPRARPHDV